MKKELRKKLLQIRKCINKKEEKDKLIINNLNKLIKDYKDILIYYPIQNEPNILSLFDNNRNYYLPYCVNELDMEYRLYKNNNFIKDYCNVYSSRVKTNNIIDVVIAPCIGVNKEGYRLGFGFGYYDRFLTRTKNVLKIALCYSEELINESFQDEWDVKFDYIVTEKEILEVK